MKNTNIGKLERKGNGSNKTIRQISRRDFLKYFLALGGGTFLAACSRSDVELIEESRWVTPTPNQLLPAEIPDTGLPGNEELQSFLHLSTLLTGIPNLDPTLGAAFLAALQGSSGFSSGLDQLYQLAGFDSGQPPETLEELESNGVFSNEQTTGTADQILTAWYTGIVGEGEEAVVVTFVDSLAMKSLHYTKPLTICASRTFWAEKPAYDPPPVRYWTGSEQGG